MKDGKRCHICKRKLNNPHDRSTQDCGGDCLRCMAWAGDPDCIARLKTIEEQAISDVIEQTEACENE